MNSITATFHKGKKYLQRTTEQKMALQFHGYMEGFSTNFLFKFIGNSSIVFLVDIYNTYKNN